MYKYSRIWSPMRDMIYANPNPFEFSNAIANFSFNKSLLAYSGNNRMP